jgi:tetratricopeptide (TPR) repeat protein
MALWHRWRGDCHKAIELIEPALPRQKKEADAGVYLNSVLHYGVALTEIGRIQEAIQVLTEARDFGTRADSLYGVIKLDNALGFTFHQICNYDSAIEYNMAAVAITQKLVGPGTATLSEVDSMARINLAENYLMTGNLEKAREHLELVYKNSEKPDYWLARPRWKPRCLLTFAEFWLQSGQIEKAESFVCQLDEHGFVEKFPYKKYQIRAGRLKGNILSESGKFEEAQDEFERALNLALQMGNPTQLWMTQKALGDLLIKFGRRRQADSQFRRAFEVVDDVATGLTDPKLKKCFLNSEPILDILAHTRAT